jgi:hypothetical protein
MINNVSCRQWAVLRGTGSAVGWKVQISVHRPGARVPDQWRYRLPDDDRRMGAHARDDADGSRESGRDRRIDRHRQPLELETIQLLQEIDEYVNFVIKY